MDDKEIKSKAVADYEDCLDYEDVVPMNGTLSDFLGDVVSTKETWERHWSAMPEYKSEDKSDIKKLIINFESEEDYNEFAKLIGQKLTMKTKTIWYPEQANSIASVLRFVDETDETTGVEFTKADLEAANKK